MRGGSTLRIAWRNLGRNPRRTALALAAIAVAQTAVLSMDGLMNGWIDSTLDAMTGPMLGHVQIHAPGWRDERAPDLVIEDAPEVLRAVRAVEGVEGAYGRVYASALIAREVDGHAALIVGVDADAEAGAGGLLEGLPEARRPQGRGVLVGATFADELGVGVGDELAILGQASDGSIANDLVTVRGVLRTQVDLVNRMGVVMPLETAQEIFAMPGEVHEINVRGRGGAEGAAALAASLSGLPALRGLEVLPWRELAPELAQFLDLSGAYGIIVLLIVFVAAAAGVANTMLMATFERRRELGMLLSLGTSPGRLVRIVVAEAVALGLVGVLLGCVVGGLLVLYWGQVGINPVALAQEEAETTEMAMYGLDLWGVIYPRLALSDLVPGFVGVTLVSILAALWPAWVTARLEPVEAMRA